MCKKQVEENYFLKNAKIKPYEIFMSIFYGTDFLINIFL